MEMIRPHSLLEAQPLAEKILAALAPQCEKIEIAGSVRRCRPYVHDIDLAVIPSNQGRLLAELMKFGRLVGGAKILRVDLGAGFMLDVYVATRETWPTILLIRTGSKDHNIALCRRAHELGMKLHADGTGLAKAGYYLKGGWIPERKIPGITCEGDIFRLLQLPYREPKLREV